MHTLSITRSTFWYSVSGMDSLSVPQSTLSYLGWHESIQMAATANSKDRINTRRAFAMEKARSMRDNPQPHPSPTDECREVFEPKYSLLDSSRSQPLCRVEKTARSISCLSMSESTDRYTVGDLGNAPPPSAFRGPIDSWNATTRVKLF